MSTTTTRLRGLAAMVRDAVEHGSTAVQRVHLATAARPFIVLEAIPAIAEPAALVHRVYDASVSFTYDNVRRVNWIVGVGVGVVLDGVEKQEG
jgi:hypothetical protein